MVNADYGLMELEKKTLEFYVFNREVNVKEKGYIQKELSDGRYAVGRVTSSNIVDRILRALRIKKGGLELKTQDFLLKKPMDNQTKEKIKEEVLTRKCDVCEDPTEYEVCFVMYRNPLFRRHHIYNRRACLEHINGVIDRGRKMWYVIKRGSIYHFSDVKVLGRVKYNQKEKKFISCPSIIEEIRPEGSLLSFGGLVYRFNRENGLLEIGDKQLFEMISDNISGELWKGVNIEIILSNVDRPIMLNNVKKIIYTEE